MLFHNMLILKSAAKIKNISKHYNQPKKNVSKHYIYAKKNV